MVSEILNGKPLFDSKTNWYTDENFDKMSKDVIDKHVRRLVLAMKCIEASGREPLDKIERRVIRAFQTAEFMYYGLDERELRILVEREEANVKGRKGSK
jgi:hypothetical protein